MYVYDQAEKANYAGQMVTGAALGQVDKRLVELTVRQNIDGQIERAKAEVTRLEGIRDRMAPELLDQRIMDLRQAMQF